MLELMSICDVPIDTMTAFMSDEFGHTGRRADGFGHLRVIRKAPSTVKSALCSSRPGACLYVIAAAADLQRSALVPLSLGS